MKNGIALLVALILGVLGFAAMYMVMNRPVGEGDLAHQAMIRVVVARHNLKNGTKLELAHLDARDIPAEYASDLHIEESRKATLVGRTLRSNVKQGDYIFLPGVEGSMTSVPEDLVDKLRYPDTHAVAIELDEPGSIGGMIKPMQKVDVIATFELSVDGKAQNEVEKKQLKESDKFAVLLMQNRTVLAVDVKTLSRYEGDVKEVKGLLVTLAVTADEALRLALAHGAGRMHLALRKADEALEPKKSAITPIDLLPADHWLSKEWTKLRQVYQAGGR